MIEVLSNLPRTLTETYDRIVSRIFRKPRGANLLRTAQRVLRWVVFARRPLTLCELAEAVAIRWDDESLNRARTIDNDMHILEACSNLIVQTPDHTIRLAHHTIQDYLLHVHRDGLSVQVDTPLIQVKDGSTVLLKACLTYLLFRDFDISIVHSSHAEVEVPSAASALAGTAERSKLMPFAASMKGLKPAPERKARLKLPQRTERKTEALAQRFAMFQYITENWHWHAQKWWMASGGTEHEWRDPTSFEQIFPRLSDVVYSDNISISCRPWLPQLSQSIPKRTKQWLLLKWSVNMDYTVMLDVLEHRSNGGPFWRTMDPSFFKEDYSTSTDYSRAGIFQQAYNAASQSAILWLAKGLRQRLPEPISIKRLIDEFPWLEVLRVSTVDSFMVFAEAMHITSQLLGTHMQAILFKVMLECDTELLYKLTLFGGRIEQLEMVYPLSAATSLNDASLLATVCKAILELAIEEWPLEDWRNALRSCIDGEFLADMFYP